jgi:hypothetical protein
MAIERHTAIALCAVCIAIVSGCGNGKADSGRARPSIALVAEGSMAITKVCKLNKQLAARVHFSQRRAHEVLEFRLGAAVSISARPGESLDHAFLYNFGSGMVSERAHGERAYCPRR